MNEKYDIKTIMKFIFIVLVIVAVFYLITIIVSNNKTTTTEKKEIEKAVIQYETILISDIFNQKEEEYYVLVKDNKDTSLESYMSNITSYKSKEGALKIYYSDLNSVFNKKYIGNDNNLNKEKFKIKTTTLLKIKNGEIEESYQTEEEISNKTKEMSE